MSIAYPPRDERVPNSGVENVMSDDFFEASPLLLDEDEVESFQDDESPSDDVLCLLEENARLRSLVVTLSNLLGDLPDREWKDAVASALNGRTARRAKIDTVCVSGQPSD